MSSITITKTEQGRKELFLKLYQECFQSVAIYIKKMGGTLDDARDIFQDALVLYYEKVLAGSLKIDHSHEAYIMGIVKNLWLKQMRNTRHFEEISGMEIMEEQSMKPKLDKILSQLKITGKKCLDLLQTFYFEQINMKEVAERFGFRSERSATVQKYKCLEKVRNEVKLKSLGYEDFLD